VAKPRRDKKPKPAQPPATRHSKTDAKNYVLIELIAQLRDHIDLHRIIGLNVKALREQDQ
jgi:hypothetical protein